MKAYTKEDVLEAIAKEIKGSSLRQVAKAKGVSCAYLSDVMLEKRGISENIAAAFGFIREVTTEIKFRKAS